jgi:hypothetical protein
MGRCDGRNIAATWPTQAEPVTDRYRLRVQLPDRPGALASLTASIADAGGNVVSLDIHDLDGDHAVDDLVVLLPGSTPDALGARLETSGVATLLSWRVEVGTSDAVVRALGWARAVLESGVGYADVELSRALSEVSSADTAWVATVAEAESIDAVRAAVASGAATVTRQDPLPAAVGDGTAGGWLLVALDDSADPTVVGLAARADHRFTATELARAEALLRLHRELRPIR